MNIDVSFEVLVDPPKDGICQVLIGRDGECAVFPLPWTQPEPPTPEDVLHRIALEIWLINTCTDQHEKYKYWFPDRDYELFDAMRAARRKVWPILGLYYDEQIRPYQKQDWDGVRRAVFQALTGGSK